MLPDTISDDEGHWLGTVPDIDYDGRGGVESSGLEDVPVPWSRVNCFNARTS